MSVTAAAAACLTLEDVTVAYDGKPALDAVTLSVPQREEIDWGFPVTVHDVVMMGRYGRLTRRLASMMVVSAAIGAFSSVAGLYASYYLDVASGAAVVLIATAAFLLAYLFAPRRGLMARRALRRAA